MSTLDSQLKQVAQECAVFDNDLLDLFNEIDAVLAGTLHSCNVGCEYLPCSHQLLLLKKLKQHEQQLNIVFGRSFIEIKRK